MGCGLLASVQMPALLTTLFQGHDISNFSYLIVTMIAGWILTYQVGHIPPPLAQRVLPSWWLH